MKQYLAAMFLLILTAAASFSLPSVLLEWQDEARIGKCSIEEAEIVQLTQQTEMSISEKVQLMSNTASSTMILGNGRNYTQETIYNKIKEELQELELLGMIDLEKQVVLPSTDAYIEFFVDVEDGAKSLMVWIANLGTRQYDLTVLLDDETGKIISVSQHNRYTEVTDAVASEGEPLFQGEAAAKSWGEYLGLTLIATSQTENELEFTDEMKKQYALLLEKGLSEEEADREICEAFGYPEPFHCFWADYTDGEGTVSYRFSFSTDTLVSSVEVSLGK